MQTDGKNYNNLPQQVILTHESVANNAQVYSKSPIPSHFIYDLMNQK